MGTTSSPTSTVVRLSLSALGWGIHDNTSPITTPSRLPGVDSNLDIPSTSSPEAVNKAAISSGDFSKGTKSLSLFIEIFIIGSVFKQFVRFRSTGDLRMQYLSPMIE